MPIDRLRSRAELALAGRVYIGNGAAAGVVLPIFSNVTQQFGLWNPAGNDRWAEIFEVGLGSYVDTTGATGGFVLAIVKEAPANTATGAAGISAFTRTVPENAVPGLESKNKVIFGVGATLTVTAPIIYRHLHINQDVIPVTSVVQQAIRGPVAEFPDRSVWLPPGNAIFLAGNIATLAKYAPTIVWGEHDAKELADFLAAVGLAA